VTNSICHDRPVRLSPLVRRITQKNPGLFTGPGTNTHLIGATALFILDPGEDRDDGHLERIVAAVGDATVAAIIPSHGHPDHWPLGPRLAARVGAPILFYGSHPGFTVDRPLGDGEVLQADGIALETLFTPGHARDHVSLHLPAEHALFPGDLVMGWSTSIIAPPDGDLRDYLRSLDRLLAVPDLAVLYPAHGPAVTAPYDRIRELIAHRNGRSRQVLAALADGPSRIGPLVARIYADVDPALHPAAAQSLLAHLVALEAEGQIERIGEAGTPTGDSALWEIRPAPGAEPAR
jgi:glyoxylase-like metal-dependent hydrolase (beta-lactamase superfamily II)